MSELPATPTRLRQIALASQNLQKAEHLLTTVFGTEVVFVDEQVSKWGLKNFLVAIGGDIIEVVAPFQEGTTAGRLLSKRGDGGYMMIMQTGDAIARREHIELNQLAKVIYGHEHDDAACVQYHPKGIPGGIMPELDSHASTVTNPTPVSSPYSPWHACGKDYQSYSAGMKRCSHLKFLGARCRLAPGDEDTGRAAKQWQMLFGVQRQGGGLQFTNMRLEFVPGNDDSGEGLESISIGVRGQKQFQQVLDNADKYGLRDGHCISMLGLDWHVSLLMESERSSKL